jgi:hypothetical protein
LIVLQISLEFCSISTALQIPQRPTYYFNNATKVALSGYQLLTLPFLNRIIKMRSASIVLASSLLFVSNAVAATWGGSWGVWKSPDWSATGNNACMTASDAQTVADNFDALIANYSDALARKTLTENFHDYTDSVIELIDNGCPNGPLPVSLPPQHHIPSISTSQNTAAD